jgi:AraC-like DNA-binding protein
MDGTVSTRILQPVFSYARMRGIDAMAVLTASDVSLEQLMDGQQRVSHEAYVRALELAAERSSDPDFGLHVAMSIQFELAGLPAFSEFVLGHLLVTAATVIDGIREVCVAYPLSYADARLSVDRTESGYTVRYLPNDAATPRTVTDYALGWVIKGIESVAERPFAPAEVRLRYGAPSDRSVCHAVYGPNIEFAAAEDALDISHESASIPFKTANAAVHEVAKKRAARALDALSPYAETVRALIAAELPGGNATAERIAERLNVSVRTFARRLAEGGTSHQAILDSVRSELADKHLRAGHSVVEVARLVGFADVSAFNRAFRRWFGCAPGTWVKKD